MNHIYIIFMPIYHENNGAVNSKNGSIAIEFFCLFQYDSSKYAKCIRKPREMLFANTLKQLIVTHIRKDAQRLGKNEDALSCELQYQPDWGWPIS